MNSRKNLHALRWFYRNLPMIICLVIVPNIIVICVFARPKLNFSSFKAKGIKLSKLSDVGKRYAKSYGSAFDYYYKNCKSSDEIQPKYRTCTNNYGFSSSLIESLSPLYLLGLQEQYELAKKYVFENFNCENMGWVNTHEFWSRGIGSLIEAFHITKEKDYLKLAKSCALSAISISSVSNPTDFMNFATKETKTNNWTNGVILSDIFAGVPELLAIGTLLKDQELISEATSALIIASNFKSYLPAAFNIDEKRISITASKANGFNLGILHNMLIILSIYNEFGIEEAIQQLATNIILPPDYAYEEYYRLLDMQQMASELVLADEITGAENLSKIVNTMFLKYPYEGYKLTEKNRRYSFSYNSSPLRDMISKASKSASKSTMDEIAKMINSVVNYGSMAKGVVGTTFTRKNVGQKGKNMPSNYFGQWSLAAGLLFNNYQSIIEKGIFNDCGHLIMCNELNPFERN
ncbi:hypothetical protein TVAG_200620 [Trichomonas vaginalis G3]|uniref:Alpha-1,2-Mannosidase n=1 Tax=Trichomonas vaginalis (strain ATCC PRA-98 / G3) TaxID=412133 RepID=A2FRZ8_TRIV3|nr:hypothetical protein TVAG_200620 [Trichomonas vaginalis G3]|eukprot:XP_001305256.1 hypothetical protein [Trichomonas vaginalis G3]